MSWIKRTYKEISTLATKKRKQRQFGIMLAIIFLAIAGYKFYKEEPYLIAACIGGGIALVTMVVPIFWMPLLHVWFFIGKILGEISSTIILGTVYYLLFFPVTFIRRLAQKKVEAGWVDHSGEIDYTKQY